MLYNGKMMKAKGLWKSVVWTVGVRQAHANRAMNVDVLDRFWLDVVGSSRLSYGAERLRLSPVARASKQAMHLSSCGR